MEYSSKEILKLIERASGIPDILAKRGSIEELLDKFSAIEEYLGRFKSLEELTLHLKEIEDKKKKVCEEIPGFTIGESGSLYFLMTKSRMIPKNSTSIVKINGNTGRVSQQLKEQPKPKPTRTKLFVVNKPKPVDDSNVQVNPEKQSPYRKDRDEENTDEVPF